MQRQGIAPNSNTSLESLGLKIHPEVRAMASEIVAWRRRLHQNPELGFEEKWTSSFVAEKLRSFGGIEVIEGIGRTGLVGLIRGASPGPCMALRADMDGLPLQEANSEFNGDYVSQNKGKMHGCGHDGHVSMLLATAKIIATKRHAMRGTVKLIFQPNEENVCGAIAQIQDGVMKAGRTGPKVDRYCNDRKALNCSNILLYIYILMHCML
jgi:metal-dependent amidase/aminoacylase/carboxypeptidase family protein